MKRSRRIILLILLALLPALICIPVTFYLLIRSSNKIIAQWDQPASIKYDSSPPFRLIIVERNTDWSDFPYTEKTYQIYVGNDYPYGDWYRFPFYYHQHDVENEIRKSTVEWSEEGITIKTTSGENLFIPTGIIVGGRS